MTTSALRLRLPAVALVGRVNVGKSSLFNRLTERRNALVSPIPGTTRDRKEATVTWRGVSFRLIDTGGVEAPTSGPASKRTKKNRRVTGDLIGLIAGQTERAVADAALSLLVVSVEDGVMPQDKRWAAALRGSRPAIAVVNKVDNGPRLAGVSEFHALGLGPPHPVSAANGRGSGDLLDVVVRHLTAAGYGEDGGPVTEREPPLTLAILGQPNSGKSSLLNAMLGEERVITSPVPHTTREPQDVPFTFDGHELLLIDTAGIRRKAHVTAGVERAGVAASLHTVDRADVVLLVIDITRGPTRQDQRLATYAVEHGKGLVLVVNKWDLVPRKTAQTMAEAERSLRQQLPGTDWIPTVFTSAVTGQRVPDVLTAARAARSAAGLALDEPTLMRFLLTVTRQHRPIKGGGVRHPTILSFKQISVSPPRFEVTARGELHVNYLKFLENRLREHFGFTGAPIQINLKTKRKKIQK